jgi:hypothetical protein
VFAITRSCDHAWDREGVVGSPLGDLGQALIVVPRLDRASREALLDEAQDAR